MGKKKQPYVFFCQERSQTDPSLRGKKLYELIDLCSDDWTNMTNEDRQKYVDMAKLHNDGYYGIIPEISFRRPPKVKPAPSSQLRGRFDSHGRSMLAMHSQQEYRTYLDAMMKRDIYNRVFEPVMKDLKKQRFHIMHINHWYETEEKSKLSIFGESKVLKYSDKAIELCNSASCEEKQRVLNIIGKNPTTVGDYLNRVRFLHSSTSIVVSTPMIQTTKASRSFPVQSAIAARKAAKSSVLLV